jgi:D-amino-acid oxidase
MCMAVPRIEVLVIGAGVSGLTTAIGLIEAGLPASSLRVVADLPPMLTTSCSAGAIWGPYLSSYDQDTDEWSRYTLRRLQDLAREPGAGVYLVNGVEASRANTEPPGWAREVEGFQPCTPDELPAGFVSGWSYTVPVVDMPIYIAYLEKWLGHAGIVVESGRFDSLAEAADMASVVVNCAGLGARRLMSDSTLNPVRGQLVVLENPGIERFFAEHTDEVCDLTYLLPQGDHIVLGGSAEVGEANCVVDQDVADGILERCAAIEPELRGARVLGNRVGLRPARPYVRVERDGGWSVPVVHNYGHGGSGVSLSWGCARDAARLVMAI